MARGETRYQRVHRLIREGLCGFLPLDLSCSCPKPRGPDHPYPEHPGKVGFLTCQGCDHRAGIHFNNRVCTHPRARQVAARWLAEAIRAWEEQQAPATLARSEQEDKAPKLQTSLSPSSPDPPRQDGPTQMTMRFA
jgi:hypothetical protein